MADYARKIGFKGKKLIEPKPFEPQEAATFRDGPTTAYWLTQWGLADEYGLNLDIDHNAKDFIKVLTTLLNKIPRTAWD